MSALAIAAAFVAATAGYWWRTRPSTVERIDGERADADLSGTL